MGKRKEKFTPIRPGRVGIYACGPTVYNYAHIGNFRTFISEDVLKRVLNRAGYRVKHVMNITDVGHLFGDDDFDEDKVVYTAEKEGKTVYEVARFYERAFVRDMHRLNVIKPDVLPRASEHIPEMLSLIKRLDRKGYLYVVPGPKGGVFFDTSRSKGYGKLAGKTFKQLSSHFKRRARLERPSGIRNVTDFAVWRFGKASEKGRAWRSQWGTGFPGWHIECSTMSMLYLSNHFDIHCGGVEHIEAHHLDEIAQNEAITGKKTVDYWFHVSFLNIDHKKMSKSLGNVYTIQDLVDKGYSPLAFRYLVLSKHYRKPFNFTFKLLGQAEGELKRIRSFLGKLNGIRRKKDAYDADTKFFLKEIDACRRQFFGSIGDDLDTPSALTAMHRLMRIAERKLAKNELSGAEANSVFETLLDFDRILGFDF